MGNAKVMVVARPLISEDAAQRDELAGAPGPRFIKVSVGLTPPGYA